MVPAGQLDLFEGLGTNSQDGDRLVILLGVGTKKRQQRDIEEAQKCWADYKRRKKREIQ